MAILFSALERSSGQLLESEFAVLLAVFLCCVTLSFGCFVGHSDLHRRNENIWNGVIPLRILRREGVYIRALEVI